MRVIVIGAGIVGVTTAWEMAADGHEVTVLERRASVAAEGSFANAGVVAPGLVAPGTAGRHDLGSMAPQLGGALRHLPWMWRSWWAGRTAVWNSHRAAMQTLAQTSRQRLLALTHRLDLDYQQGDGHLVLLRHARDLKAQRGTLKRLAELGTEFHLVDAERARQIEPSLNPAQPLHAAIHLPQDGVGNSRQFAHLLKQEAQRRGVVFRFDAEVRAIEPGTGSATSPAVVLADGSRLEAGAVVVCAGAAAAPLLSPLGLALPLAPVWSVSVTAPVNHVDGALPVAPQAALTDARHQVTISRLGQRVRVAGGAALGTAPGRTPAEPRLATLRQLYRVLDDWFPGSAVMRQAQHWTGARPVLPDGTPLLGASGRPGVWLNLAHGEHGWALACGSALALTAAVAGRDPGVDLAPFGIERLR